jgi:hypothetical protein
MTFYIMWWYNRHFLRVEQYRRNKFWGLCWSKSGPMFPSVILRTGILYTTELCYHLRDLQCRQLPLPPHCWASRSPPHTSLARERASATRLGTRQQVWHNYPSPPHPILDLEVCSLDIHDPLLPSLFALPVSLKARLVAVCHIDRVRPPAGCPDSGPEDIPKGRI